MSQETDSGVRAGRLKLYTSFKRGSPDSQGYTLIKIEPEGDDPVRKKHILAINIYAGITVYDIHIDEVVYPITERNRTNW